MSGPKKCCWQLSPSFCRQNPFVGSPNLQHPKPTLHQSQATASYAHQSVQFMGPMLSVLVIMSISLYKCAYVPYMLWIILDSYIMGPKNEIYITSSDRTKKEAVANMSSSCLVILGHNFFFLSQAGPFPAQKKIIL